MQTAVEEAAERVHGGLNGQAVGGGDLGAQLRVVAAHGGPSGGLEGVRVEPDAEGFSGAWVAKGQVDAVHHSLVLAPDRNGGPKRHQKLFVGGVQFSPVLLRGFLGSGQLREKALAGVHLPVGVGGVLQHDADTVQGDAQVPSGPGRPVGSLGEHRGPDQGPGVLGEFPHGLGGERYLGREGADGFDGLVGGLDAEGACEV